MNVTTPAPFAAAFADLCEERGLTRTRAATLIAASVPNGVSPAAVHKSLSGSRPVSLAVMEATAAFFDVDPSVFAEHELEDVRRRLDPRVVGLDAALEELRRLRGEA